MGCFLLLFLWLLAACGPVRVNVYGASGKVFTAPDLCAALVQCRSSAETSCYYQRDEIDHADGSHTENGCAEVKK